MWDTETEPVIQRQRGSSWGRPFVIVIGFSTESANATILVVDQGRLWSTGRHSWEPAMEKLAIFYWSPAGAVSDIETGGPQSGESNNHGIRSAVGDLRRWWWCQRRQHYLVGW